MTETYSIAGYTRISVDDELDKDNTSIENQKSIISDFVAHRFPGSELTFYEDRDRSGYTFEQREQYQAMRRELMAHRLDILVVKDFSRFSRRNSRGLVELEDLRDAGVRIISVGDNIDFPNDDDWLKIQFQFLINEMPVTDTSKKIKAVIRRRQQDGKWICAAPYGYVVNKKNEFEIVPEQAAVVRKIFALYNEGCGYKKIANILTDEGIPTPRMVEKLRIEADGGECRLKPKSAWSIVTVQEMLDNDFYIGTLRQGKYTRAKINGKDVKRDEADHIVIENHHPAVIDYKTFATTKEMRERRTQTNYRGVKKYSNTYSGFLRCGNCGAPMFCRNRPDLAPSYLCGTYFKQGKAHCSAHTIRVDRLDTLVKSYVQRLIDSSSEMLKEMISETEDAKAGKGIALSTKKLEEMASDLREEMKATKRQRIRDIMKHPESEDAISETYDELEADLQKKIDAVTKQLKILGDQNNDKVRAERSVKTVAEVLNEILKKDSLTAQDIGLIVNQITVFEDHVEIELQPDVNAVLQAASNASPLTITPKTTPETELIVNVINNGDPSQTTLTKTIIFSFHIFQLCQRINH